MELYKSKYSTVIPKGPVLEKDDILFLFHRADVLEDEVCLARSLLENTTDTQSFEREQDRLWALQLELGQAEVGAFKMGAIRALSLAREQRDLFTVDTYLRGWQKAERMIASLRQEILVGPRAALRTLLLARMHIDLVASSSM